MLAPLKVRLFLAILSLPLLIPVAHHLGWISYGVQSAWREFLRDWACVTFVAGIWNGVHTWWISGGLPVPVERKNPPFRLVIWARILGFIYGCVALLVISIIWSWTFDMLSPVIQQRIGAALMPFCFGSIIGFWSFAFGPRPPG